MTVKFILPKSYFGYLKLLTFPVIALSGGFDFSTNSNCTWTIIGFLVYAFLIYLDWCQCNCIEFDTNQLICTYDFPYNRRRLYLLAMVTKVEIVEVYGRGVSSSVNLSFEDRIETVYFMGTLATLEQIHDEFKNREIPVSLKRYDANEF